MEVNIRRARVPDVAGIKKLIDHWSADGLLVPRSFSYLYENFRDFFVAELNEKIIGCCSLHIVWSDLAEIKCLAIHTDHKLAGIGKNLINACLNEAKEMGIKRVFALTTVPEFFEKLDFTSVRKSSLPRKVWGECISCVKYPNCNEKAVVYVEK